VALSNSPLEGSPDRGCAPVAALERYMLFLVIWLFPLTVYCSFKYQFFFYVVAGISIFLVIAHMKAQSSLAIAVTMTCLTLPLAHKRL
jgi:hypothetical protein